MSTIINDTRKADLFKLAAKLGREEGEGKNSRPMFGHIAFMGAADGVIYSGDDKKVKDDVKPLYEKYLNGLGDRYTFAGAADTSEKSTKVQISKLRQFVIVGGLPFFSTSRDNGTSTVAKDFATLCGDRITNLAQLSVKSVPVYDKLVAIMRAQRAKVKAGTAAPLTQDEIDAAIAPSASSPEELTVVRQLMGRLRKLAEKPEFAGSAEYLEAAARVLAPRVEMLEAMEQDEALEETLADIPPEKIQAIMEAIAAKKAA
jgi:hypothetical protein